MPEQERRTRKELRAEISAREREKTHTLIKQVVAVQITAMVMLFAVGFVILDGQSSRLEVQGVHLVENVRTGCQAGNITKAYVRIFGTALNLAPRSSKLPHIDGVEPGNPIIDCDQLPARRVPIMPALQDRFVALVASGIKPTVHSGKIDLESQGP